MTIKKQIAQMVSEAADTEELADALWDFIEEAEDEQLEDFASYVAGMLMADDSEDGEEPEEDE